MSDMQSAIRAVMLDDEPDPAPVRPRPLEVPAGVQPSTPPVVTLPNLEDPRWLIFASVALAATLGAVLFAVVNFRPPKMDVLSASIVAAPVFVVVTATPQPAAQPPTAPAPIVIIVTTTPPQPVYVAPVTQPQPAQRAERRPLPPPVQPQPTAWPAPATGTAKGSMGYQCPDGRYFPADDGRWGMFGFGQWIANGQGDVIDIRDTNDANDGKLGWHTKCQRTWR